VVEKGWRVGGSTCPSLLEEERGKKRRTEHLEGTADLPKKFVGVKGISATCKEKPHNLRLTEIFKISRVK